MARSPRDDSTPPKAKPGNGGEPHQTASAPDVRITTNHGVPVRDNQNSLKAGSRGPTLLEDFVLRERIQHLDHERIPERVVHARGSAAHGNFELTDSLGEFSRAKILAEVGVQTELFTRFSNVADDKVGAEPDVGIVALGKSTEVFLAPGRTRQWAREPNVRALA